LDVSPSTPDLPVTEGRAPTDVVFIVGAARSGTTLLYKALCLHPDIAYISNWVARFPRIPRVAALNRAARLMPATAQRVWFGSDSNAYVYGERRPLRDRLFPMPVEGEPVYGRCGIRKPGAGDVVAAEDPERRLRAMMHTIRRSAGGRVLVSKRIANNLRIPLLARAFPEARFIEIVRDGRAVAHSLSRVDWWEDSYVWWYGGTPKSWRAEGRDPWEMCARNWVEELAEIEAGLVGVPHQQVLRVRYEGLVEDPVSVLADVAAFAGVGESRRWREGLTRLRHPNRNETWRTKLDPDVVRTITSVQAERLREHGYES
jgi:hypothetical protein